MRFWLHALKSVLAERLFQFGDGARRGLVLQVQFPQKEVGDGGNVGRQEGSDVRKELRDGAGGV